MSIETFDYTTAYCEHGNGVYLAEGETLESVVARDKGILEQHGVTCTEVGRSLRKLLSTYNEFLDYRSPGPQHPCPGITLSRQVFELGQEWCPYIKGLYSNIDWRVLVDGMGNGNKAYHPQDGPTFVSDMLPEMIEQLGFFEGSAFYGIQPEWGIAVHRIVQANELIPYVPKRTMRAWDGFKALCVEEKGYWLQRAGEWPPDQIRAAAIHHEVLPGNITAFIAPGNLDLKGQPWSKGYYSGLPNDKRANEYWALLIVAQDTRLPLDATLMGLPFGEHLSWFTKGQLRVIRLFPYNEKLVG